MTTVDFYLNDVWKRTLILIEQTGQFSEEEISVIFQNSKLISIDNGAATIAGNNFVSCLCMRQNNIVIQNCLEEILNEKLLIHIIDINEVVDKNPDSFVTNNYMHLSIDNNFTFANFVVGRSNAQAQVASLTVATNLGLIYNPLFIYGNSGLGKTHLLNAIGNQVKNNFPNKKIGFITGLEFVEGVANSIKDKKIEEFKNSFNNLDLLLIDDIQFIAGKEKTHEIFFQVFNNLVNNRKQICMTADRTPSEIKGLEDRIISRFNQGLNVNIEAPEYETSINILKLKINNIGSLQTVDEEVYSYIASHFSQDVRSLEGAINRLLFYSINFSDEDHITLKLASEAFKDQITDTKDVISYNKIKKAVADYYNLSKQQLISKERTKNITNARHIAIYLCRKLMDAPYKDIGNEFGKRDHSTVMSACAVVEKKIKTDPLYLKVINEIEGKIR